MKHWKQKYSLSTSSMILTSVVPRLFVAPQMYSPESCRPTLGRIRLLFTTLCLQGRGDRSLDQVIVGEGYPVKRESSKLYVVQLSLNHTVLFLQRSLAMSGKKKSGLMNTLAFCVSITVGLTAECCSLSLHHNHQRLRNRYPGH